MPAHNGNFDAYDSEMPTFIKENPWDLTESLVKNCEIHWVLEQLGQVCTKTG